MQDTEFAGARTRAPGAALPDTHPEWEMSDLDPTVDNGGIDEADDGPIEDPVVYREVMLDYAWKNRNAETLQSMCSQGARPMRSSLDREVRDDETILFFGSLVTRRHAIAFAYQLDSVTALERALDTDECWDCEPESYASAVRGVGDLFPRADDDIELTFTP
jgi:hypothetical protein